ncbi:MAG: hypothetical protein QOG25_2948 [Acetobacteraceae bacterium]|jgi:hypothetical protein|nr:hypothetical protein [Acetobacteraceae bacterium]
MVAVETPEKAASEAGSMVMKYSDLLVRDDAYSRAIGRSARCQCTKRKVPLGEVRKVPVDEVPLDEVPVDEVPVDEAPVDEVRKMPHRRDHTRLFRRLVRRAGQDSLGVHRQFAQRLVQGVPFRLCQASCEGRLDVTCLGNEAGI